MTDQEIYQKLIEHLNNPVWEFTESEHKMPMITSYISPGEAEFLTGFPHNAATLEQIAEIKKMDAAELLSKIKPLCRKGIIYEGIRGDSVRFKLWSAWEIFIRIPFWSGKDEEPMKTMAHHSNKYYMDGWFDQKKAFKHPELRAIPINETVENPKEFLPFEDILQVIDNYEFYAVSHCSCRVKHKLDHDYENSRYPEEVCLHFDELGRYCVNNGLGREITKEETLEILKKAADAGLVHGLVNTEENPDTICNCDLEYCTYFKPFHQLGFHFSVDASNYVVKSNTNTCKACGLCVKRCPMDALQLKFSPKATNRFRKAVELNNELCIGCGVCVHKCKAKSIVLERKEVVTRPPKTIKDLVNINTMAVLTKKGLMENQD